MIPVIRNLSQALVVASSDAVRDDVVQSLHTFGIAVLSTDQVDECIGKVPAGPSLVILHPNGFRFDQIVGILFALRRERPDAHAVLVTETPDRYLKLIVSAHHAPPLAVISMPLLSRKVLEMVAAAATPGAQERTQAISHAPTGAR